MLTSYYTYNSLRLACGKYLHQKVLCAGLKTPVRLRKFGVECILNIYTRPNLKIDNKLKTKRDKASIVGGIFCGDIRHELNFEFLILNFEFDRRSYLFNGIGIDT